MYSQCCSEFIFLMRFLKLRFFCVPMQFLGQFIYSDSISSALCTRSHQWTVQYTLLHCKMNLVETQFTLWQTAVRVLLKKIQCKTLEPLCFASRLEKRALIIFNKICFGLVPMHRSALNIQCRSGFVFLLCFWKYGFSEFKCTFLVKLLRAILDQFCRVHEILPLWSRTSQWTLKYNFLYRKINLDRILCT